MINNIFTIRSNCLDPYRNQAIEKCLLDTCDDDAVIMYLWQNRNTVVVGRNQDCFAECRVRRLEEEGGHLARRLTGGGAVYHDAGNLNFTFICSAGNYDVDRQNKVIMEAVSGLGLHAEKNGRNDMTIAGRKFSGHAYYRSRENCMHHGTIMIDVDTSQMSRYLSAGQQKLRSNGVRSVRSRVMNLAEKIKDVSLEDVAGAMEKAFAGVYGIAAETMQSPPENEIPQRRKHFADEKWLYGSSFSGDRAISKRFDWGELTIKLRMNDDLITDCRVFSDSLVWDDIEKLPGAMKNIPWEPELLKEVLTSSRIRKDIVDFIADSARERYTQEQE